MGVRYILALVLMIAVMIGWSLFFGKRFAPQPDEPATTGTPAASSPSETQSDATTHGTFDGADASVNPDLWTPVGESPGDGKVSVRTDNYTIVFNEKLAIAKKWQLNHFPDRTDADKNPLNLIPENALNCLALRFGNSQLQLDSLRARWKADKSEINITNGQEAVTLIFGTTIGEKLRVTKQFTFNPGNYFVDMTVTFQKCL